MTNRAPSTPRVRVTTKFLSDVILPPECPISLRHLNRR